MTRPPLFPAGAAFVAGGSGGIGSAICLALAEAGSDVVLTYNRNRDRADEIVRQVQALGRQATAFPLRLEDADTVVYAVGPFVEFRFMSQVEPAMFADYMTRHACACFNLVHAALPHLRRSRGSLVAITTTAVARWANRDGLSAVPKAAVNTLMRGIAREEGRFGVRANMVALGIIQAGMFNQTVEKGYIDEKYLKAMATNVPLQRLGTAEEVADAAVVLASSLAGYTTGQVLHVDGGYPL